MEAPRKIVRGYRGLKEYTGYSSTKLEELIRTEPDFPQPVKLGDRAVGFYEDDIARWQKKRDAETARLNAEKQSAKKPKAKNHAA